MNSTETRIDWTRVLNRVDTQLARRGGDDPLPAETIAAFARAIEAQVGDRSSMTAESAGVVDTAGQLAERDQELARLADRLERAQRDLEQAAHAAPPADLGERHAAVLARNVELEDQLETARGDLDAVLAERDELRTQLKAAQRPRIPAPAPHKHHYPWDSMDVLPGRCECGKPHPYTVGFEPDDDAGDSVVIPPWDTLMRQVRDELEADGWPS